MVRTFTGGPLEPIHHSDAKWHCRLLEQLILPGKDDTFPGEGTVQFHAEHRWFDFSNANSPWWQFKDMWKNADVCRPHTQDGGARAFGYEGGRRGVRGSMGMRHGPDGGW